MGNLLSSLSKTIHASAILAILIFVGLFFQTVALILIEYSGAVARFIHVVVGIMWIGLLWYFNFVQIKYG